MLIEDIRRKQTEAKRKISDLERELEAARADLKHTTICLNSEVDKAYTNGVRPARIAEWLGVSRQTMTKRLRHLPKQRVFGNPLKQEAEYATWTYMLYKARHDESAPAVLFADYKDFVAKLGRANGRHLVHKRGTDYGPDTCRWGTLSEARAGKFDVDSTPIDAKPPTHP